MSECKWPIIVRGRYVSQKHFGYEMKKTIRDGVAPSTAYTAYTVYAVYIVYTAYDEVSDLVFNAVALC